MTGPTEPRTRFLIAIEARGDFNAGWLAFVLGVPFACGYDKPVAWAEGWKMAEETPSLHPVRDTFVAQLGLTRPQFVVDVATDALRHEPLPDPGTVGEPPGRAVS